MEWLQSEITQAQAFQDKLLFWAVVAKKTSSKKGDMYWRDLYIVYSLRKALEFHLDQGPFSNTVLNDIVSRLREYTWVSNLDDAVFIEVRGRDYLDCLGELECQTYPEIEVTSEEETSEEDTSGDETSDEGTSDEDTSDDDTTGDETTGDETSSDEETTGGILFLVRFGTYKCVVEYDESETTTDPTPITTVRIQSSYAYFGSYVCVEETTEQETTTVVQLASARFTDHVCQLQDLPCDLSVEILAMDPETDLDISTELIYTKCADCGFYLE